MIDKEEEKYRRDRGLLSCEAEVKSLMSQKKLSGYYDTIKPLLRWGIHVRLVDVGDEDSLPVGTSKLGGRPDLPLNIEWPLSGFDQPMEFIGQFNLEEVHQADVAGQMPTKGVVFLFLSFDYANEDAWSPKTFKVIYVDNVRDLVRRDFPDDVENWQQPIKMEFVDYLSLPTFEWYELEKMGMNQEERDAYNEISSTQGQMIMLGHILTIQAPMKYECEEQRLYKEMGDAFPDRYEDREPLYTQLNDWIPFFYYNESCIDEMGDYSDIGFCIRKQDLKKGDFSQMCCVMQYD